MKFNFSYWLRQYIQQAFSVTNNRLGAIDGLRALAVVLVFNVHFFGAAVKEGALVAESELIHAVVMVLRAGHIGVDFFFLISGYLILLTLNRATTPWNFLLKRFIRLWPVLAATTLSWLFVTRGDVPFFDIVLNLLFVAPLIEGVQVVNHVTWSLTWEWIFYILICVAAILIGRHPLFWIAFVLAGAGFMQWLDIGGKNFIQADRFVAFGVGMCIALIPPSSLAKLNGRLVGVLASVAFIGLVLLQVAWAFRATEITAAPFNMGFYLAVSILFGVIVLAALNRESWVAKVFSSKLLRWMGSLSYSFYLLHALALIALHSRISGSSITEMIAWYLATFSVVTLASVFFYLLFERPYFARAASRQTTSA